MRRTVRGSADDIGWLQRDSGMPQVEDGTERFMEILESIRYVLFACACYASAWYGYSYVDSVVSLSDRHGVHRLPNSVVYLLVPGRNFHSPFVKGIY